MSKSRGDRGNKTPSVNQNAPPPNQNVIVPGRFTEGDWNDLLENETCEEFVSDIVSDIADVACDIIFKKIISDRVAPYAVFAAKELLLEFVEWEFIKCDVGENVLQEVAWCEDDEPVACVTDSWAQGAVPVVHSINVFRKGGSETVTLEENKTTPRIDEEDSKELNEEEKREKNEEADENNNDQENDEPIKNKEDQRTEDKEAITDSESMKISPEQTSSISTQPNSTIRNSSMESPLMESLPGKTSSSPEVPLSPVPPKSSRNLQSQHRNSNTYKKHKGSLPTFTAISLSPVTDDRPKPGAGAMSKDRHGAPIHSSDSLFKHQHGRPPGVKEVIYNEAGNVVHVQKINIAALPDHRVKTKCSIIDSTQQNMKKTSRKFKGIDLSNSYDDAQKTNTKNKIDPYSLINQAGGQDVDILRTLRTHSPDVLRTLRTPLPPSLVDTADISEGVVIKEGVLSKSGPKVQPLAYVDEQSLKPIQSGRGRKLDVHDIINKTKPTLNSYSRSKPLPAILM
eukprot:TCONS_00048634-protein